MIVINNDIASDPGLNALFIDYMFILRFSFNVHSYNNGFNIVNLYPLTPNDIIALFKE